MNEENKIKYEHFKQKLQTEDVYFVNSFEEIAARRDTRAKKYFLKPKGKREYEVKISSTVLADAILEYKEISEEVYYSY